MIHYSVVSQLLSTFTSQPNLGDNRAWNVIFLNIRGNNYADKWKALMDKIEERNCSVFCIQETKREHFDNSYIKKFSPKRFDKFAFSPSRGTPGGLLVGWNSKVF